MCGCLKGGCLLFSKQNSCVPRSLYRLIIKTEFLPTKYRGYMLPLSQVRGSGNSLEPGVSDRTGPGGGDGSGGGVLPAS